MDHDIEQKLVKSIRVSSLRILKLLTEHPLALKEVSEHLHGNGFKSSMKSEALEVIEEVQHQLEMIEQFKKSLLTAKLNLVVKIAHFYKQQVNQPQVYQHHSAMHFLDLIQEGNIGLMKAVDQFDYCRDPQVSSQAGSQAGSQGFSKYVQRSIHQAISQALTQTLIKNSL
jgi:DNA-directed RNA polymerase sigma subunit (sigma70/sigma32)